MNSANRLSRRRFLVRSGAAATLGLCADALADCGRVDCPHSKKGPDIRFGFTTYTWGKPWDIPTIIANCTKAGAFGVELRTSQNYAHGVELTLTARQRREVKKRFEDSPVTLVGLATSERFDSPDPAKLNRAIENARAYLKLSHDVGATGIRVFPNDFHKDEPHEKTIARIAEALNTLGPAAEELNQQIRLENHGSAGEMVNLKRIMDRVSHPSIRIKLNCDKRDMAGRGLEYNFNLVKDKLGHTIHAHDFRDTQFGYQQLMNLLVKNNYRGWMLIENSSRVEDRLAALIGQRTIFETMLRKAMKK